MQVKRSALMWGFLVSSFVHASDPLPRLGLDPSDVTVSGISSGGTMAMQMHITYSGLIHGAGIVSAAPYRCGEQGARAALECMKGLWKNTTANCSSSAPPPACLSPAAHAVQAAQEFARVRRIDKLENLQDDPVLIMWGADDPVVSRPTIEWTYRFYELAKGLSKGSSERVRGSLLLAAPIAHMGHTFPTSTEGIDCEKSSNPFIGHCGRDAAGEILNFLHSNRSTVTPVKASTQGVLKAFDQTAFTRQVGGWMSFTIGMASDGWIYIPAVCRTSKCGLHVAFHGCEQDADTTVPKRAFVERAGYNRWAEAYKLVILYPQVKKSYFLPTNPMGCWDWWGYSGSTLYDTNQGRQLQSVKLMIDELMRPAVGSPQNQQSPTSASQP